MERTSARVSLARHVLAPLIVVAVFMVSLQPTAHAVSYIQNQMHISPQFFSRGTVEINTRTRYDWIIVPNPYTSNYMINVQHKHFRRPNLLRTNLTNRQWQSINPDADIGGERSWRVQWNVGWVGAATTRYYVGWAEIKTLSVGADGGVNRHGQYGTSASHGSPEYVSTYRFAPGGPGVIIEP
jgi:hypothetical protein